MLLNSPKKLIVEEIQRLKNNEYIYDGDIESKDHYEEMYKLLKEYKKVLSVDFLGFKGITDEMNTFVANINQISESMTLTSKDIAGVVEQVAMGQYLKQKTQEELLIDLMKIYKL